MSLPELHQWRPRLHRRDIETARGVQCRPIGCLWPAIEYCDDTNLLCDLMKLGASLLLPRLCSLPSPPSLGSSCRPSPRQSRGTSICWPRLSNAAPCVGGDHVDSYISTGLLRFHCIFPNISFV